jgi:CDGSH-type Zn-finger protein
VSEATRIVITPTGNGSNRIVGPMVIMDAEGNVIREADEIYLCRCGQSSNKPFCDGTHKTCGFESQVRAAT